MHYNDGMKKQYFKRILVTLFSVLSITSCNSTSIEEERLYIKPLDHECGSTEIICFENKSLTEKYIYVTYNDNEYQHARKHLKEISQSFIGEKLDDVVVWSYDECGHYTKEETYYDAEVFSIKKISSDCAIALRFKNDDKYYGYYNFKANLDTLNDFYSKLDFINSYSFSYVFHTFKDKEGNEKIYRFDDFDDNIVFQTLFNDKELVNQWDGIGQLSASEYNQGRFVTFYTYSDVLGHNEQSLVHLTNRGYAIIFFHYHSYVFKIGQPKIDQFINYLYQNVNKTRVEFVYIACAE